MHHSRRVPILLFCALTFRALASDPSEPEPAKRPPSPEDWEIHVEFTAYVLPRKIVEPLLDDLTDDQKAGAAYEKIRATVNKGTGSHVGTLSICTDHCREAKAQNSIEEKYPTEFHAPIFLDVQSKREINSLSGPSKSVALPPAGFETRNVGLAFNASPAVSADGATFQIDAMMSHTRLVGHTEITSGITPKGARLYITQPRFAVYSNSGYFFLARNVPILAGVHYPLEGPDTAELFFLRAWAKAKPEVK